MNIKSPIKTGFLCVFLQKFWPEKMAPTIYSVFQTFFSYFYQIKQLVEGF